MAAQAGLEEARCEIEEGYLDDALQRCRRILVQEPEHEGAKALLDEAEERRQRAGDLYPAIIQGLEARSLNETHALLHDTLRVQRRHPLARLAQVKLAARARGYRLAVEKGVDAAKRHDLVAAIAWLRRARDLNPGDGDAEVALQYVEGLHGRVAGVQQRIEEAVDAGEWSRALALAEDILRDARAASPAVQEQKGGR
jgi:tetratricopeptide (TPR) repeat protein